MNKIFLGLVSVLYLGATVYYVLNKQYGLSLAFLCYSIANLGFMNV